jgi:hypothetical protein
MTVPLTMSRCGSPKRLRCPRQSIIRQSSSPRRTPLRRASGSVGIEADSGANPHTRRDLPDDGPAEYQMIGRLVGVRAAEAVGPARVSPKPGSIVVVRGRGPATAIGHGRHTRQGIGRRSSSLGRAGGAIVSAAFPAPVIQ